MGSDPDREYTVTYFIDGVAREHALVGDRQLVGRAKHCDLCFPFNSEISRLHATFAFDDGAWCVEDMASRSGTYVNGEKLTHPRRLNDRDVLVIGKVKLTFRAKRYGDETVDSDELQALMSAKLTNSLRPSSAEQSPSLPYEDELQAERNYYDLLRVPLFEGDVDKISQAGKQRLRELREGSAAAEPARLEAETGDVSKAIVFLTNPNRKRDYDIRLAERIGCEVEVRGDYVVPKDRIPPVSILVGMLVIISLVLIAWFGAQSLIDALSPWFDERHLF